MFFRNKALEARTGIEPSILQEQHAAELQKIRQSRRPTQEAASQAGRPRESAKVDIKKIMEGIMMDSEKLQARLAESVHATDATMAIPTKKGRTRKNKGKGKEGDQWRMLAPQQRGRRRRARRMGKERRRRMRVLTIERRPPSDAKEPSSPILRAPGTGLLCQCRRGQQRRRHV